jgi:hypothetical protein
MNNNSNESLKRQLLVSENSGKSLRTRNASMLNKTNQDNSMLNTSQMVYQNRSIGRSVLSSRKRTSFF